MMNNKLNKELNKTDNIAQNDKYDESFIFGYIFLSWLFAILIFFYELFIGPMFNALFPQINSLLSSLNLSENQVITQTNQLVPIPFNQFIIVELALILPPAILLGLIYYDTKKENHDD